MNQAQLAQPLGVTQSRVSAIEKWPGGGQPGSIYGSFAIARCRTGHTHSCSKPSTAFSAAHHG
ncbi:hypothetical protein N0K08_08545 [Acidovorax sp. Be4]|uniref:Uncharacterized protein n=1 Tax=Acidovorax bellezanensis TaxID=2976702 RepID=A0ABT2PKB8_9BURK|nr:hypothetical protein [Acidovorax sp. Be4]MCT9810680.1 hypothetical protein [Acidovorax sp. Be4]